MTIKLLILGGTTEARLLAERLLHDARYAAMLSFAGRTENLQRPGVPHRIGGFGGVEGLAAHLRDAGYEALVDATHPFSPRISQNAVQAAALTGTPLLRLLRPAWQPAAGDQWQVVNDMAEAASALGDAPRRVFLTVGKQELLPFAAAPQHHYLIRTIDEVQVALPHAQLLQARGPFALEDELTLLREQRIDVLVSKNAGTRATYAKIEAARALQLPVVMVARPLLPDAPEVHTLAEVETWLAALHQRSSLRGV